MDSERWVTHVACERKKYILHLIKEWKKLVMAMDCLNNWSKSTIAEERLQLFLTWQRREFRRGYVRILIHWNSPTWDPVPHIESTDKMYTTSKLPPIMRFSGDLTCRESTSYLSAMCLYTISSRGFSFWKLNLAKNTWTKSPNTKYKKEEIQHWRDLRHSCETCLINDLT